MKGTDILNTVPFSFLLWKSKAGRGKGMAQKIKAMQGKGIAPS